LRRNNGLLFLMVAALAVVLVLVTALPAVELRPGLASYAVPPSDEALSGELRQLLSCLVLTVILGAVAVLYFVRRRVPAVLLTGVTVLALLFLFLFWTYSEPELSELQPATATPGPAVTPEMVERAEPPAEEVEVQEVEPFTPPSPWVALAAAFTLSAVLVTAVASVTWYLWLTSQSPVPAPATEMADLAREAQSAVDALRSGAPLYDVVIRCYHDMSRVLSERRGIERAEAMTPAEFEGHLLRLGMPQEPVSNLTRLFEEVRYGTKEPGPAEGERALASLTAIVQACEVDS
jgi:hypothetical protein